MKRGALRTRWRKKLYNYSFRRIQLSAPEGT